MLVGILTTIRNTSDPPQLLTFCSSLALGVRASVQRIASLSLLTLWLRVEDQDASYLEWIRATTAANRRRVTDIAERSYSIPQTMPALEPVRK
jgi:hypothetical protein